MSVNNVVLVGRLTKDVELRYTQTGVAVARFTVAVNRAFSNQQGEKDADFISCVAWRKTAENLANFMSKGSQIGVVGSIQTGTYDDKDGKRVYTTDVICNNIQFLESRSEQQSQPQQQYQAPPQQQQKPQYQQQQPFVAQPMNDEDLPF